VVMSERVPQRMERGALEAGVERSVIRAVTAVKTMVMTHLACSIYVLRCVVRYISKDGLSNFLLGAYRHARTQQGPRASPA